MDKRLLSILFFLSGACGLIYEVLWIRLFSFVVGNTYLVISLIVASFMFGLFLGSWLVGRFIGKCRNELRWYAFLELIIGGYALFLLFSYGFLDTAFTGLHAVLGKSDLLFSSGQFITTLLFIIIPTSAMGATLPLVVQYFTSHKKYFGDNISLFYTLNTMGGAVGALAAGFYIIEHLGIREGLVLTAMINIVIGVIVLFFLRKREPQNPDGDEKKHFKDGKKPAAKQSEREDKMLYLLAAGLAGFTALSYEMIWTRGLKFLIHSSTYSFSVILFIFLLGIAIGSGVARRIIRESTRLHLAYGLLQVILGLYAIFTIGLLYGFSYTDFFQEKIVGIIYDYSYDWLWAIGIYALICSLMFLIPTVIMGILFPLINELFFENVAQKAGRTVGSIYAVNTIGSIAGSLGAGFFLLPALGIKLSLLLVSAINLILGVVFILKARAKMPLVISFAALIFLVVFSFSLDGRHLLGRNEKKEDRVLFYDEGLMATVKVFERKGELFMSIDGITIASTDRVLYKKEKLIGHLPFFVKPDIKKALAVGLASGISAGCMTVHKNVEQIDCVELVRPVFQAAAYFSSYNYDISKNKKVNLIYDDIYAYLKYTDEKYDLISSDGKLGPLYSGNTVMLSADYYELCKTRLASDGLFIQWIPITTPHKELKVLLDTLKKSFKHVVLFYFYPTDVYMLASESPILLDKSYMDQMFLEEAVKRELEPFALRDGVSILSSFIGVYEFSPDETVRINSFDRPILEFEYMREWKKSRSWEGGYRAKNLEFLTQNFEKTDLNILPGIFRNVEKQMLEGIVHASRLFYKGAIMYFKTGNLQSSFEEYMRFNRK